MHSKSSEYDMFILCDDNQIYFVKKDFLSSRILNQPLKDSNEMITSRISLLLKEKMNNLFPQGLPSEFNTDAQPSMSSDPELSDINE